MRIQVKAACSHAEKTLSHRRRITTEEKTKVVASVGGGGGIFIKFLAALAVLLRTILNNRINSTRMIC